MSDNVTAFPKVAGDLPDNSLQPDNKHYGFCQHQAVRLNDFDRVVICASCGATMDAFDFLRSSARTIERAWSDHKSMHLRVVELNERITALKKEEQRLRAAVRRLQSKQSDTITGRVERL